MLDFNMQNQLKTYLEGPVFPIELLASLDDSAGSRELEALLRQIAALSDKINVRRSDEARKPSFAIRRSGSDITVRFAGMPLGHEFSFLVLALLQVGGHPPKAEPGLLRRVRELPGEYRFETYFSLSCQNCPDVVQALNLLSVLNPRIHHVAIDGASFQSEVRAREIMAVPGVFLNGEPFAQGRMDLGRILAKLDSTSSEVVSPTALIVTDRSSRASAARFSAAAIPVSKRLSISRESPRT